MTTTYATTNVQNGVAEEYRATSVVNGSAVREPAPRRVRGLRFPVLPSGAWLAQVGGGASTLLGAYMWRGLAATLIIGGIAAVVLGMLREAKKI